MLADIIYQELFLLTLISIMVIANVYKDRNVLDGTYNIIRRVITNDRMFICIMSTIYGILPVPGRIGIATGMFDTCTDKRSPRQDLGILAYIATHHYYLWSPLEKSVIIVIASAGITYVQFIQHMWLYIVLMIIMTLYYVFFVMTKPVVIEFKPTEKRSIEPLLLIGGISICCLGFIDVKYFFPVYGLYTILKYRVWDAHKRVEWSLILIAGVVIAISTIVKSHSESLLEILNNITTQYGLHVALIASFFTAVLLGSSSKFAAVTSLMVSIYGVMYLPLFYIFDFCGYLLSPSHKCVHIGRLYFKTRVVAFYKVVGIITLVLMLTSIMKTIMINNE
jgi:hypothetical protein